MSYGLAIDPGMSTGICLFSWGGPSEASKDGDHALGGSFKQEAMWQVTGGAAGLAQFLNYKNVRVTVSGELMLGSIPLARIVVEKFTPRPHESFSLTQKAVEPLRGEGVLIGRGFKPFIDWQEPSMQYFMGGANLADRKRRSREFLKLHGLYVTGGMIGQKDADDAISAQLHAIAWLRRKRHMPTLVELFQEEEPA